MLFVKRNRKFFAVFGFFYEQAVFLIIAGVGDFFGPAVVLFQFAKFSFQIFFFLS